MEINLEDSLGLGKFGKAADRLVQIVQNGLGIYINPAKKISEATAEMEIEKYRLIHKHELERIDLAERARDRLFETEIRRQYNLEEIFTPACQLLSEDASPEMVSKDWLNHFVASSQDVGEEDLRKIWARLLVGEATNPGKFSKRTLDYLKNFSVSDCKLFEKFLPFTFRSGDLVFIIDPYNNMDKFGDKFNFRSLEFEHLQTIGIVGPHMRQLNVRGYSEILYFNRKIKFTSSTVGLTIGLATIYVLTEVGCQLTHVVDSIENKEYLEEVISNIKKQNLKIEKYEII